MDHCQRLAAKDRPQDKFAGSGRSLQEVVKVHRDQLVIRCCAGCLSGRRGRNAGLVLHDIGCAGGRHGILMYDFTFGVHGVSHRQTSTEWLRMNTSMSDIRYRIVQSQPG